MKKLFALFVAVAFVVTVAGLAVAQEKKAEPAKPAAAGEMKKEAPKATDNAAKTGEKKPAEKKATEKKKTEKKKAEPKKEAAPAAKPADNTAKPPAKK